MKWTNVATVTTVTVLVCVLSSVTGNKKVAKPIVQVYYESLCGDSRRFISNMLYPLKTSPFGEHFYVQLIPYGKAQTNRTGDNYSFRCQHGANECRGNKLQACAIRHLNEDQSLQFVHCAMTAKYPPDALDECTQQLRVSKDDIETCVHSKEGDQLLADNGDRTHSLSPKLYFVPWITISGIFEEEKFQRALVDLKGVICGEYQKIGKPLEACKGVNLKTMKMSGSGSLPTLRLKNSNNNILQLLTTFTFLLMSMF